MLVLDRRDQLVLAEELVPEFVDVIAANRVGATHVVLHVDGDVLPQAAALERHQTRDGQRMLADRLVALNVRREGPEVAVARQETARSHQLHFVLPTSVWHHPGVPRVVPQTDTESNQVVDVVFRKGDPRLVAAHLEVGETAFDAAVPPEIPAQPRRELGAGFLEPTQLVVANEVCSVEVERNVVPEHPGVAGVEKERGGTAEKNPPRNLDVASEQVD